SPGACIEQPPTAADRHQVVFVDAGHGGVDPGAQGTGPGGVPVSEKDVTLGVALALAPLLRAKGFTVVLSRTADTLVANLPEQDLNADGSLTPDGFRADLEARVACANSAHAEAMVAIHFNVFDDPTAVGSQAFYDPDRPFAHNSLQLAQDVEAGLIGQFRSSGWDIPDRGVQSDTADGGPALTPADAAYGHFIELGPVSPGVANIASDMPGTLVEPLFLSNPTEAAVAASSAGQQVMAAGLQQGITTFLRA
ncbi:MAG: N-acetylmuramoyl-L-alanine amidase, partial [Actinobacteria bacterium]|nr:N-acetylmuramoyl-L-alanine amidase [Actinomycetota bacterium]